MKKVVATHSAHETFELGKEFASGLQRSDIVALYGDLGSGKTQFAKGVCFGLGVRNHVVSPSFTILNEYTEGKYPVYHLISTGSVLSPSWRNLGLKNSFRRWDLPLKWANIVASALPLNRYDVALELGEGRKPKGHSHC